MKSDSMTLLMIISALSLTVGCRLDAPFSVGGKCQGITQENIIHTSSDPCMQSEPNTCAEVDKDAVDMGYCPEGFACIDNHGVVQCKHGCESDKVMCNGECINPLFSITNCGAKLKGSCSDSSSQSNNYEGVDCSTVKSDSHMVCNNGKCEESTCQPDYHIVPKEDGTTGCEPNSSDACGSIDVKCKNTEVCKAGICSESCPESQIACGGKCIDPMTDKAYCGATDGCVGYEACTDGKVCSNGECRILDCLNANESKCVVDEVEQCIDVASDVNNCGSCGYQCELHKPAYSVVVGCENKQCKYECEGSYTNCGSGSTIECVDLSNAKLHCGRCGNECTGKKYCHDSTCKENNCGDTQCPQGEQCKDNDVEACGPNCENCLTKYHAATATCDNSGTCHVLTCTSGYHLTETSGNYSCVPNENTSCGSTDDVHVTNCEGIENVNVASCELDGTCKVYSCKSGYHVYNNKCEKNDNSHCGVHNNACHVENGTSDCDQSKGTCKTTKCDDGYHKVSNADDTQCTSDNDLECGPNKINCKTSINGWQSGDCEDGECVLKTCTSEYHVYNNTCELNSNSACGKSRRQCSNSSYQIYECTGSGDTASCTVTGCTGDYHFYSNYCEANSVDNCGSHNYKCSSHIPGWSSGTCTDGKCVVSGCQEGYSNIGNVVCVRNCFRPSYGMHSDYCCGTSERARDCDETGNCTASYVGNSFNSCESNIYFYKHSSYSTDYYDSCLTSVTGIDLSAFPTFCVDSIYCPYETCQDFKNNPSYYYYDDDLEPFYDTLSRECFIEEGGIYDCSEYY